MSNQLNAPRARSGHAALWVIAAVVIAIALLIIWWMTGGWTTAGVPKNLDQADPFTAPAAAPD